MLIDRTKDSYLEPIGQPVEAQPVVTVSPGQPAANAEQFGKSAMQARRQRRQRRLERSGNHTISGWTVRAW